MDWCRAFRVTLYDTSLGPSSIYHPIRLQIHPKYEQRIAGSLGLLNLSFSIGEVTCLLGVLRGLVF